MQIALVHVNSIQGISSAFINFSAPSISSFNPRTGIHGAIVTIFGSNFGPSSAPRKAFIGKSECKDISTVQDFQGLSCSLSVGTGANLPIVVSVGGQEGSSTPLFFTYSAPKISSVDKVQSPSSGSINANVFGFQFGMVKPSLVYRLVGPHK